MKPSLLLLVVLCAFAAGCSRSAQTARRPVSPFEAQARNAVHAGDGDLEIQALRRRLLETPHDSALRRRLADRFAAAGYPDLALEHLRIAAELAPADFALQLDLAAALQTQGLSTQARQVLSAALTTTTSTAEQLSRAAILTDQVDGPVAGEAIHRRVLGRAAQNPDYTNNLAYNLMLQKRAAEAESLLRELLVRKPAHERARNNLATLYATQLNRPEEALLHWKAINGPAAAHNNLAAVYIEQGKWDLARTELEKALTLRFQFPEAMANLKIVAARTNGTVELNLSRDNKHPGLSKLAKVFRHVFVGNERETVQMKTQGVVHESR